MTLVIVIMQAFTLYGSYINVFFLNTFANPTKIIGHFNVSAFWQSTAHAFGRAIFMILKDASPIFT